MKNVLVIVAISLSIAAVGGYFILANNGNLGTAYVAKNICSGVFVSKLPADRVFNQAVVPVNPSFSHVNYQVDQLNKRVTAKVFGLYTRAAQFREGLGCTILPQGQDSLAAINMTLPNHYGVSDYQQIVGEQNIGARPQIEKALDYAFAENHPKGAKNTNAFVLLQHGKIIAERYADGISIDTPLVGWSMSKSITNLLMAILVREKKLSLDDFAPVAEWQDGDPRAKITINNLMQMSSGLEFGEVYTGYSDVAHMLVNEIDTAAYAATKPLLYKPGEYWHYSSGTTNIISRIIQQHTGGSPESFYRFAQSELFQPLGIGQAFIEPDPSGVYVGSSYSYLTARDWAKLGQLLLQNGQWRGRQILPDGWAEYSATPTTANPDNIYGAQFYLNANPQDLNKIRTYPDVPADAYRMSGYQGQSVLVIPSLDMVAVRLGFTTKPVDNGMNEIMRRIIMAIN